MQELFLALILIISTTVLLTQMYNQLLHINTINQLQINKCTIQKHEQNKNSPKINVRIILGNQKDLLFSTQIVTKQSLYQKNHLYIHKNYVLSLRHVLGRVLQLQKELYCRDYSTIQYIFIMISVSRFFFLWENTMQNTHFLLRSVNQQCEKLHTKTHTQIILQIYRRQFYQQYQEIPCNQGWQKSQVRSKILLCRRLGKKRRSVGHRFLWSPTVGTYDCLRLPTIGTYFVLLPKIYQQTRDFLDFFNVFSSIVNISTTTYKPVLLQVNPISEIEKEIFQQNISCF
eukprot:TRINITY_DN4381_c0_g3_i2.p1 TRINITY_DN4381_c0_g3~~TRINITY_DN4381_c0_g3_i2.p1  ORF type:complete len:286 (+),score=-35.04 TRINITY_DN4381_c0_g3_i2:264-1121(+)